MTTVPVPPQILLAAARAIRGHFRFESGDHGDLWLELDALLADARCTAWAAELARRAAGARPEIACGPERGGASLAQSIARELGIAAASARRGVDPASGAVRYALDGPDRGRLRDRRVLLVDDAVNAGSAWSATARAIRDSGGTIVALATLLALGDAAARIARELEAPLFALAHVDRGLWRAPDCPLCRAGTALEHRSPAG